MPAIPKGQRFTKQQTEYTMFPEEYFTASDCTIYFGDVWVDDLSAITFSLTENVVPIYGYASKTWDYVLRGRRIIRGQFRIAFRESGYLFTILDHIGQLKTIAKPALAYVLAGEEVPKWHAGIQERIEETIARWNGKDAAKPTTRSVPRWDSLSLSKGMRTGDVMELQYALYEVGFYNGIPNGNYDDATVSAVADYKKFKGFGGDGNTAGQDVRNALGYTETVVAPDKDLGSLTPNGVAEARMVQYEKDIWGRHDVAKGEVGRKFDTFFYRGRTSDVNGLHTSTLYQNGIDIYINYGPLPAFLKQQVDKATDSVSFNTTVRALRNVQIGAVQQLIDANTGNPIEEVYEFIAQDLD